MIAFFNSLFGGGAPVPPINKPVLAGSNIVADGNSIVFGAVVGPDNSWPSQIQHIVPFDTNRCMWNNLGVNGQKTTDMIADFNSQVSPLKQPGGNIYLWLELTNDLYFGATVSEAFTHAKTLGNMAKADGWWVGMCTCLPRSNAGTPPTFEADRQALNSLIRGDSTFYNFLIDIGDDSLMGQAGQETDTYYYADLVHPTIEGQARLAELIRDATVLNTL